MIHIENPSKRQDWDKVAAALTNGALNLISGSAVGIYTAVKEIRGGDTLAKPTIEQLAGEWVQSTIMEAMARVVTDRRLPTALSGAQLKDAIADFLTAAIEFDGTEQVKPAHLVNPSACAAFTPGRKALPAFLTRISPGHGITDEGAGTLFDKCLNMQASRVQGEDPARFKPFLDRLMGPLSTALLRELAWSRHADWIRGLYEREPIFAQEKDSGLTLARTYLKLRCFWHERIESDQDEDKTAWRAHIGRLHDTMHAWLEAPDNDPIRIIAGTPGCGKSSFAQAFATEVIDKAKSGANRRVILIRLQHFTMGDDLEERLGAHLRKRCQELKPEGGEGFPENPLEWMQQDATPCLIIFDGLDELTHSDARAEEHTRQFLTILQRMVAGRSGDLRAVVLGRSAACQAAMREAHVDDDRLLHMLPLRPLKDQDFAADGFVAGRRAVAQHVDPDALGAADQRPDFWRQWQRANGALESATPEAVTARSMEALNAEPLLLYLLILSGYAAENWREAEDNPNVVYHAIFKRVYARNKDKAHIAGHGLSATDFSTLMECLGLAAWQGNGRTGSDAEFARLRGLHVSKAQKRRFKDLPAASLKNVAVQFYTRQDLGDGAGFEFVHKSFGEYLAGRALLRAGERFADRLSGDEAEDPEDVAPDWIALIGEGELTTEIIGVLRREAMLLPEGRALFIVDALAPLLAWAMTNGFPLHRADDAGATSWRVLETRQRGAETALLGVLSACSIAARREAGVGAESDLARFKLSGSADTDRPALRALERLHASGSLAGGVLSGADLSRADLNNADLTGADLRGADLSGAYLCGANLLVARLSGANLRGVNLSGADLRQAKNLKQVQIDTAFGDASTKRPQGFVIPKIWTKDRD